MSHDVTLYVSRTAGLISFAASFGFCMLRTVDLPVVTSVVVTVQFLQTPVESQLAAVTTPRIRSPGLTCTSSLWISFPDRQQFSLSMAHLPGISLKSSTG